MTEVTASTDLCAHDVSCADSSYAKCPHCSQDLCLEHLIEHQQIVRLQFNELIDRVNERKAASNNHSAIFDVRDQLITGLNEWKSKKIEIIVALYEQKRTKVEEICEKYVNEKAKLQSSTFEEINTASNAIEKKKNTHPNDIQQIEQKLKELNGRVEALQTSIRTDLNSAVENMKLPDVIAVEKQLHKAQAEIAKMTEEHRQAIYWKDSAVNMANAERKSLQLRLETKEENINSLRKQLEEKINTKDQEINNLRQNQRRFRVVT